MILTKIRKESRKTLAVTSAGIPSTLIRGNRTTHCALKLQADLYKSGNQICHSKTSALAGATRQCHIIVCDESTMMHRTVRQSISQVLRDIKNRQSLMESVCLVFIWRFFQLYQKELKLMRPEHDSMSKP